MAGKPRGSWTQGKGSERPRTRTAPETAETRPRGPKRQRRQRRQHRRIRCAQAIFSLELTVSLSDENAWLKDAANGTGSYVHSFEAASADLPAWDETKLSLVTVDVPSNIDAASYQLQIGVSVLADTPDSVLDAYRRSQTDSEGFTGNSLLSTYSIWKSEYALQFESAIGSALADCLVTVAATYADEASETGSYVLAPVADFPQRYARYLDNVDAYRDEVRRLMDEGKASETIIQQVPREPALFQTERVG